MFRQLFKLTNVVSNHLYKINVFNKKLSSNIRTTTRSSNQFIELKRQEENQKSLKKQRIAKHVHAMKDAFHRLI